MKSYNIELTEVEINIINQMFTWGQLEIIRQMKRLGQFDFDVKEYFWLYRSGSNDIKNKIIKIRGY